MPRDDFDPDVPVVAVASLRDDAVAQACVVELPRSIAGAARCSTARTRYMRTVRDALPSLMRIVGASPWNDLAAPSLNAAIHTPSEQYRRQAASLAIALLREEDTEHANAAYLKEVIRATLVGWQLSLRGDGGPALRCSRRDEMLGVVAASVIQILTETTGYQTGSLLGDVARHLRWLRQRPVATPWVEAATICALADGSLLTRDASLLRASRTRLTSLLRRQDEEGWFAENGGADIGRLSLTIDSLARLYRGGVRDELAAPIRRALRFLMHFVHPDGSVGGCYGSHGTKFLSPYGVELLAADFPDAAALALVCRRAAGGIRSEDSSHARANRCPALAASAGLAAGVAASDVNSTSKWPHGEMGWTRFPRAALSIVSTPAYYAVINGRKGGAVRITWRDGGAPDVDAGLIAVYPHRVRVSGRMDARTRERVCPPLVESAGVLRRPSPATRGLLRWIRNAWRRTVRLFRSETLHDPLAVAKPTTDRRLLVRDLFSRTVSFEDDHVRIVDTVQCHLPCRTIMLRTPLPGAEDLLATEETEQRPPIFVDGGRNVEITRVLRGR